MNFKNRLAIRLISWLVIVGLLLSILGGVALFWIIDRMTQIEANRQFENAGLYQLIQTLESRDGQLYFDPQLLELIRESGAGCNAWMNREKSPIRFSRPMTCRTRMGRESLPLIGWEKVRFRTSCFCGYRRKMASGTRWCTE